MHIEMTFHEGWLSPRNYQNYFTWGTHFAETKLVASTIGNPEETSILISSTFTEVGTISFSFCNPSLGPTSTIFTNPGILLNNCKTSCKLLDNTIPVFKIETSKPEDLHICTEKSENCSIWYWNCQHFNMCKHSQARI